MKNNNEVNNVEFLRIGDVIIVLRQVETVELRNKAVNKGSGGTMPESCVTMRLNRSLVKYDPDGVAAGSSGVVYHFFGEAAEALRAWWRQSENVVNLAQWWREKGNGHGTAVERDFCGAGEVPPSVPGPPRLKKF